MAIVKPPVVPAWAETASGSPDIVQPTDGFIQAGWPLTTIPPSRGFFNWVLHFAANGIRYLSKFGIVDWDAAETYGLGAIVRETYTEATGFVRRSYFQVTGTPTIGLAPDLDTLNWAICLELPIAQPLNWTREIMSWRNARRMRRFRVDHMGYSAGPIIAWEECFDRFVAGAAFPSSGDLWTPAIVTSGGITTRPPGGVPAGSLFPRVELGPAATLGAEVTLWKMGSCRADTSDLGLSMRWKACMSEVGANRTTMVMGLVDSASVGTDPPIYGVYFRKTNSDTNWQCYYKTEAGTLTSTSTVIGPVVDTWQDFRIEILGANVSDDSAGAIRFYINDVLAATMSVDVSTLAGTSIAALSPSFSAITTTGSGATVLLWIAAIKYRHNTDTTA